MSSRTSLPAKPPVRATIERHMSRMLESLPGTEVARRRFQTAAVAVAMNPMVAKCDPISVLKAVYTCARLNLYPDPALHHAAVVPFRNNKRNCMEATLIIEYRGLIELAKRANPGLTIRAGTVYEGDDYRLSEGTEAKLDIQRRWWEKGLAEAGKPKLFYAVGREPGVDEPVLVVVPAIEAEQIGRSSKAGMRPGTPWHDHFERMGEKTAIRRMVRFLRFDPDADATARLATAIEWDERTEDGGAPPLQDDEDLFGGEAGDEPAPPAAEQPQELPEGEHAFGRAAAGGGRQRRQRATQEPQAAEEPHELEGGDIPPDPTPKPDPKKQMLKDLRVAIDKRLVELGVNPDTPSRKKLTHDALGPETCELLRVDPDAMGEADIRHCIELVQGFVWPEPEQDGGPRAEADEADR